MMYCTVLFCTVLYIGMTSQYSTVVPYRQYKNCAVQLGINTFGRTEQKGAKVKIIFTNITSDSAHQLKLRKEINYDKSLKYIKNKTKYYFPNASYSIYNIIFFSNKLYTNSLMAFN